MGGGDAMNRATDKVGDGGFTGTPSPASRKCLCGCGTPVVNKFVRGHVMRYLADNATRWAVDAETGCWNWTGAMSPNGYGQSRGSGAHREIYQRFKGPIPEGLTLDHLCRNRRCVNPEHLEAVTQSTNVRRGNSGKYSARLVEVIASWLLVGARSVDIAKFCGVKPGYVRNVKMRGVR